MLNPPKRRMNQNNFENSIILQILIQDKKNRKSKIKNTSSHQHI
jgi:hypothetical protein